ncbi:hypothetical protein EYC80_007723 [Monilinia laxa]|uniref:Uncharacterized protein n=1 Tax=Monilinia laxa TaxID=61186 RepID=A0A5N6JWW5_MONLA|nr:hypothetical protein EYC80_007723 [Monilinia laxa]
MLSSICSQKRRNRSCRENYRGGHFPQSKTYALLHEEEQHLADHIAVLAQAREGPHGVSAATIEECSNKTLPSLVIRIASNETPSERVVDGLHKCLNTVENIARADSDQDEESNKSKLLSQIILLSECRLRSRIKPKRKGCGKTRVSLHTGVERLRCILSEQNMGVNSNSYHWRNSLCSHLSNLFREIEGLVPTSDMSHVEHLTKIVLAAHKVSKNANGFSLEHQLHAKDTKLEPSHHRTVTQIDKISRYLDICNDLIHYCQKARCRHLFGNIQFEVCTAPKDQRVHGEVQLVFFYEQYPAALPPRCIGSSKSACFLCDLFIRKHGKYYISHSHARLYPKWTIPQGEWINEDKASRYDSILRDMIEEMVIIERDFVRRRGYEGNGAESRVHFLALPQSAKSSTPSVPKTLEHEVRLLNFYNSQSRKNETKGSELICLDVARFEDHSDARSTRVANLEAKVNEESAMHHSSGTQSQVSAARKIAVPTKSSHPSFPIASESSLKLPLCNSETTTVEVETKVAETELPTIHGNNFAHLSTSMKLTIREPMPRFFPVIPISRDPNPTFHLHDLPLKFLISPDIPIDSYILSIGKVEYTFDIQDMECGYLLIERSSQVEGKEKSKSINIRGQLLDTKMTIPSCQSNTSSSLLEFSINDEGDFGICVKVLWGEE